MVKKLYKYYVIFTSNINDEEIKLPARNKQEALRKVKQLNRENRRSRHNSMIIHGRSFILYKNIRIRGR